MFIIKLFILLISYSILQSALIKYNSYSCISKYYGTWLAGLLCYKVLLLLFGSFLAWQTRHVSFPGLNDSKFIGISVYNVVICSIIVAPSQHFVSREKAELYYGIISFGIVLCTASVLKLIFIPKVWLQQNQKEA